MKHINNLTLFLAATLAIAVAASAAAGYSAGVTKGSNLYFTYTSFSSLMARPVKPSSNDEKDVARYELEGQEYVEAAELYLNNAMADITRISNEIDTATAETNDFIDEYNKLMRDSY